MPEELTLPGMLAFMTAALLPLYEHAEKNESLQPSFRKAAATMQAGAAMLLNEQDRACLKLLCETFENAQWS